MRFRVECVDHRCEVVPRGYPFGADWTNWSYVRREDLSRREPVWELALNTKCVWCFGGKGKPGCRVVVRVMDANDNWHVLTAGVIANGF